MDSVIKIPAAAKKLNCSEAYVRELCRTSQLKATKVGREYVIQESEINKYLGIEVSEETFKKDLYIKDLESQVKHYKLIISALKGSIDNVNTILHCNL